MNAIQLLSAQPWVDRLGSTLLHFVWEGLLIAALYAVVRRWPGHAHRPPQFRYLLACAALALMAMAPVLTWIWIKPAAPEFVAASFTAPLGSAGAPAVRDVPATAPSDLADTRPSPVLSWVVALWISGTVCFLIRLSGGWIVASSLRWRAAHAPASEWLRIFDSLRERMAVAYPVRLLVSAAAHAPAVVGWLRPVVLVPAGVFAGLPHEQIEALLLHELAHIRRHDYLVNMIQGIIEAALFYHPAVWWISAHIRTEREHCCDDLAVSITGDALTYVRALSEMASSGPSPFRAALAATGGFLAHRVSRLIGETRPAPTSGSGPGIAGGMILLGIAAAAVFGQAGDRPRFEAASVKLSPESRFMRVRPHPGGLSAIASVRLLMQNAYTLQPFQILGAPSWAESEHFEIEAKAAPNSSRTQVFLMLQSLLEERFQLRIHREARELPVYNLVPARSGLKLPRPAEGTCENAPPDAPLDWAGGRMQPPGQGAATLPHCGSVLVRLDPAGAQMQGGKIAMPEFIRVLSMVMGRAVVDKTGFVELFDVRLAFLPDQASAALPPPPPDSAASVDPRYPSIVTALQEQLGLRLESGKGPVDVIVVDHLERPTAN
jgi:uncharacterized protein (TIGR03435 family)